VDSQEDLLKTVMASTPLPWKEATGNFVLEFGITALTERGRNRLRVRGLSGSLSKRSAPEQETSVSLKTRDYDLDGFSVDVALGEPNNPQLIFHDPTK
jgi:hypothetical protein